MNPKQFDNLKSEFDIPKANDDKLIKIDGIQPVVVPKEHITHLHTDYEEIRTNLKDIIKRGAEAIDGILMVASETQQPRAYEVVATLIKSVAEVNKDLLSMHKQMQDIKKETPLGGPQSANQITNNSIFVGSTTELQALLKGKIEQLRHIDE